MIKLSTKAVVSMCFAGALCFALCGCSLNINIGGNTSKTEDQSSSKAESSEPESSKEESSKEEKSEPAESSEEVKTGKDAMYDAYAKVVEDLIKKEGKPEKTSTGYLNGVAVVRLMDFDGDGTEEMYCVYPQDNDMFANKQEIYGYSDGEAVSLFKDRVQNWGSGVEPFVEYIVTDKKAYILTDYRSTMSEFKGTWVTVEKQKPKDAFSFYTNSVSFESGEAVGAELIFKINNKKVPEAKFDESRKKFENAGESCRIMIASSEDESAIDETKKVMKQLGVSV